MCDFAFREDGYTDYVQSWVLQLQHKGQRASEVFLAKSFIYH